MLAFTCYATAAVPLWVSWKNTLWVWSAVPMGKQAVLVLWQQSPLPAPAPAPQTLRWSAAVRSCRSSLALHSSLTWPKRTSVAWDLSSSEKHRRRSSASCQVDLLLWSWAAEEHPASILSSPPLPDPLACPHSLWFLALFIQAQHHSVHHWKLGLQARCTDLLPFLWGCLVYLLRVY